MRIGVVEVAIIVAVVVGLLLALAARRRSVPAAEQLARIFDEPAGPIPGPRARRWALGVLYEAGVDADADKPYAAKVLRDAEPRLSPAAARALVDTVDLS